MKLQKEPSGFRTDELSSLPQNGEGMRGNRPMRDTTAVRHGSGVRTGRDGNSEQGQQSVPRLHQWTRRREVSPERSRRIGAGYRRRR